MAMLRIAAIVLVVSSVLALEQTKLQVDDLPSVPAVPGAPKVEVFPVPTTCRCIVIMCVQYMLIYTALAVCRTTLWQTILQSWSAPSVKG
jgi:hypothetical protein